MAIRTDEILTPPVPPVVVKPVSSGPRKKMSIIPIKNIAPVSKTVSSTSKIKSPPLAFVINPVEKGPANPKTTGLGSQVKSDTEEELFGSGSEGIFGTGEEAENGAGSLSGVSGYVWIGAAILLGYFLIK
jgi:hypothetical protein